MSLSNDQSVYREKTIEHLFVGKLLLHDWKHGEAKVEILKPEIDRLGYDLVVCRGNII